MTSNLEAAREAFRARQGAGARYDAAGAPTRELSGARLAAAQFLRVVSRLSDSELGLPSSGANFTNAEVIAHACMQGRILAEAIGWVREGSSGPTPSKFAITRAEIAFGGTLPAGALRNLVEHVQVHLDVEWRDLSTEQWNTTAFDEDKITLALNQTPVLRARFLNRACGLLGINLAVSGDAPMLKASSTEFWQRTLGSSI